MSLNPIREHRELTVCAPVRVLLAEVNTNKIRDGMMEIKVGGSDLKSPSVAIGWLYMCMLKHVYHCEP